MDESSRINNDKIVAHSAGFHHSVHNGNDGKTLLYDTRYDADQTSRNLKVTLKDKYDHEFIFGDVIDVDEALEKYESMNWDKKIQPNVPGGTAKKNEHDSQESENIDFGRIGKNKAVTSIKTTAMTIGKENNKKTSSDPMEEMKGKERDERQRHVQRMMASTTNVRSQESIQQIRTPNQQQHLKTPPQPKFKAPPPTHTTPIASITDDMVGLQSSVRDSLLNSQPASTMKKNTVTSEYAGSQLVDRKSGIEHHRASVAVADPMLAAKEQERRNRYVSMTLTRPSGSATTAKSTTTEPKVDPMMTAKQKEREYRMQRLSGSATTANASATASAKASGGISSDPTMDAAKQREREIRRTYSSDRSTVRAASMRTSTTVSAKTGGGISSDPMMQSERELRRTYSSGRTNVAVATKSISTAESVATASAKISVGIPSDPTMDAKQREREIRRTYSSERTTVPVASIPTSIAASVKTGDSASSDPMMDAKQREREFRRTHSSERTSIPVASMPASTAASVKTGDSASSDPMMDAKKREREFRRTYSSERTSVPVASMPTSTAASVKTGDSASSDPMMDAKQREREIRRSYSSERTTVPVASMPTSTAASAKTGGVISSDPMVDAKQREREFRRTYSSERTSVPVASMPTSTAASVKTGGRATSDPMIDAKQREREFRRTYSSERTSVPVASMPTSKAASAMTSGSVASDPMRDAKQREREFRRAHAVTAATVFFGPNSTAATAKTSLSTSSDPMRDAKQREREFRRTHAATARTVLAGPNSEVTGHAFPSVPMIDTKQQQRELRRASSAESDSLHFPSDSTSKVTAVTGSINDSGANDPSCKQCDEPYTAAASSDGSVFENQNIVGVSKSSHITNRLDRVSSYRSGLQSINEDNDCKPKATDTLHETGSIDGVSNKSIKGVDDEDDISTISASSRLRSGSVCSCRSTKADEDIATKLRERETRLRQMEHMVAIDALTASSHHHPGTTNTSTGRDSDTKDVPIPVSRMKLKPRSQQLMAEMKNAGTTTATNADGNNYSSYPNPQPQSNKNSHATSGSSFDECLEAARSNVPSTLSLSQQARIDREAAKLSEAYGQRTFKAEKTLRRSNHDDSCSNFSGNESVLELLSGPREPCDNNDVHVHSSPSHPFSIEESVFVRPDDPSIDDGRLSFREDVPTSEDNIYPFLFPGAFAVDGVGERDDDTSNETDDVDEVHNDSGSDIHSHSTPQQVVGEPLLISDHDDTERIEEAGLDNAFIAELHEEIVVDAAIIEPQNDDDVDVKTLRNLRHVQVSIICFCLAAICVVCLSIVGGFKSFTGGNIVKIEIEGWKPIGTKTYGLTEIAQARFGSSIVMSSDGRRVAVSAPGFDNVTKVNVGKLFIMDETVGSNGTIEWKVVDSKVGQYTNELPDMPLTASRDFKTIAVGYPHIQGGGSVEIYEANSDGKTWTDAPITLNTTKFGYPTWFGYSVSMSSNGNTLVIGAPMKNSDSFIGAGAVYVYARNVSGTKDGDWHQVGPTITGSRVDEYFGWSVAVSVLSGDNTIRVAIGAPVALNSTGIVRVFDLHPETKIWNQVGNDFLGVEEFERYGETVSMSINGKTLAVGARGTGFSAGYVEVYREVNLQWTTGNVRSVASDQVDDNDSPSVKMMMGEDGGEAFGSSVALSDDGTIVAVGVPQNSLYGSDSGLVRVFAFDKVEQETEIWTEIGKYVGVNDGIQDFGTSVAISSDGSRIAGGAPGTSYAEKLPFVGCFQVFENQLKVSTE